MPTQLVVRVTSRVRRTGRRAALLTRVARHTAAVEGFSAGSLSIVAVGARAMSNIHQRFMKVTGATDVITFDLGTDRRAGVIDGEIYVCCDVARRAAAARLRRGGRRRKAPARVLAATRAELALYVVHGVLHLAGYDDHGARDYRRMHAREDELLTELGIGRVFASAPEA